LNLLALPYNLHITSIQDTMPQHILTGIVMKTNLVVWELFLTKKHNTYKKSVLYTSRDYWGSKLSITN